MAGIALTATLALSACGSDNEAPTDAGGASAAISSNPTETEDYITGRFG